MLIVSIGWKDYTHKVPHQALHEALSYITNGAAYRCNLETSPVDILRMPR